MKKVQLTPDMTLEEARRQFVELLDEGTICPCCGRFAKIYRRKITSGMALGLLIILRHCRNSGSDVVHIERLIKESDCPTGIRGDITKFTHWGFLEKQPTAGYYRLTKTGKEFAMNEVLAPKAVYVYNNRAIRWDTEQTSIIQTLDDKFNLDELMGYEVRKENPTRSLSLAQQDLFD